MKTLNSHIALLLFVAMTTPAIAAEKARVITKGNAIRSDCRFFAPVKARLRYDDVVEVLSREGDWFRVSFKGVKGCLHKSAVEAKGFKLGSLLGAPRAGATSEEVALAGKGFNPQVEASYRGKHPELDFRTVDLVEQFDVPSDELSEFIRKGGLNPP